MVISFIYTVIVNSYTAAAVDNGTVLVAEKSFNINQRKLPSFRLKVYLTG